MPLKKRRKRNNGNTKEKRAIATRLMIISLKIDDYIYKNKPISVQDAQMYIEEIATYKLKCSNDERSMQVIEKLNLFMKTIIKDNNSNNNSNTNYNIGSSIRSETIGDTNTLDLSDMTNMNKEVITGFDVDTKSETSQKTPVNENSINLNKHSNPFTNNYINDSVIKVPLAIENDANKVFYKDNSLNEPTAQSKLKYSGANNYIDGNNSDKTITNNIEHVVQKLTIDNNTTAENNKVAKLTNICKCSLDSLKQTSKGNVPQKVTRAKTKRCNKKTIDATNKEVKRKNTKKERNDPNTKVTRKRKNKSEVFIKNDKINSNNDTVANMSDSKAVYEPISILEDGKEVIDVSWMDNIKYVREISKEEYNLNLEETFWSDHTLPVDWNFNDFDYRD